MPFPPFDHFWGILGFGDIIRLHQQMILCLLLMLFAIPIVFISLQKWFGPNELLDSSWLTLLTVRCFGHRGIGEASLPAVVCCRIDPWSANFSVITRINDARQNWKSCGFTNFFEALSLLCSMWIAVWHKTESWFCCHITSTVLCQQALS